MRGSQPQSRERGRTIATVFTVWLALSLVVPAPSPASTLESAPTSALSSFAPPAAGVADVPQTGGVSLLLSGAGVRAPGWSIVPITVHLVPQAPGTVWYRWGPGPGAWTRSTGALLAPEGKQQLSAVLVSPQGVPGTPASWTVRSDFDEIPSRLPISLHGPEAIGATPSASGIVTVRVVVRSGAATTVRRVGGRDRFEVAAGVSAGFPNASTAIVASGEKFPDALTASGLAGCLGSPLLLTKRASAPASLLREIARLGTTHVIVCGGPLSVDPAVVAQLKGAGVTVERIDGPDRYAVAANTAARIATLCGGKSRVLIARGDLYPDALSLGPIAYSRKEPILLVQPGTLPSATRAALRGYSSAGIAGGTASVSPGVASQIAGIVGSTVRWGGADRYQAAVTIASAGVAGGSNRWSHVSIAKGTDYADALTGGTGAGRAGGVLLLTAPSPLSSATDKALRAQAGDIDTVDVLGGPVSITEGTYEQIRAIFQ